MVTLYARYGGNSLCEVQHEPSGEHITTDAPLEFNGNTAYFSPTDLIAAALVSCLLTSIASVAEKYGIDVSGMEGGVRKIMADELPRRILKISVKIDIPLPQDHPLRDKLERAIRYCPVHDALHPGIEKDIVTTWRVAEQTARQALG